MRLSILLRNLRRSAAHDDPFASLVEHLGDARHDLRKVECLVEADSDVARRQLGRVPDEPPRDAPSLIVKGRVEVPRDGRLVLYLFEPTRPGLLTPPRALVVGHRED